MSVLWNLGSATVAEVRERLPDDLAYTTVLTVLRTLEQKGHVAHTGEGRAHRYRPLVKRAAAGRSALRRLWVKSSSFPTSISVTRSCAACASCWPIGSGRSSHDRRLDAVLHRYRFGPHPRRVCGGTRALPRRPADPLGVERCVDRHAFPADRRDRTTAGLQGHPRAPRRAHARPGGGSRSGAAPRNGSLYTRLWTRAQVERLRRRPEVGMGPIIRRRAARARGGGRPGGRAAA